MRKEEKELIESGFRQIDKSVRDSIQSHISSLSIQVAMFEEANKEAHKQIIGRQDKMNSRIGCVENETRFMRWCARNPKSAVVVVILLFVGTITLGIAFGLDKLINIIK